MNISAEKGRELFIDDDWVQGSLPEGSVIEKVRLIRFRGGTSYERDCLLIDFTFDWFGCLGYDISSRRTLEVVLRYREGFMGNVISSYARLGDTEEYFDFRVDTAIESGAVVDGIRFDGGNLLVDYHSGEGLRTLVIRMGCSPDRGGMLVQSCFREV